MWIRVVFNAFIDGQEPSAVRLVQGPYAGKSAVVLPWSAYLAPLNLLKPLRHLFEEGDGHAVAFLTDQRGWAGQIDAPGLTQRMKSLIEVDLDNGRILSSDHQASETVEVDVATGKVTGREIANIRRLFEFVPLSAWTSTTSAAGPGRGERTYSYLLRANGSDPLVSLSWVRPISYGGELTIYIRPPAKPLGTGEVEVGFAGYATHFPSFEALVCVEGQTEVLFRVPPEPGRTVTSLMLGAQKGRLRGTCRLSVHMARRHEPDGALAF